MCLSAAFEICLDVETETAIVKSYSMFSFDMGWAGPWCWATAGLLAGRIQNDAFAGKGWKEEKAPAQKRHVLKTAAFGYLQALDILWHSSFQECCVSVMFTFWDAVHQQ